MKKLILIVAVGQTLLSISNKTGLQLLNVLVTLILPPSSFNYTQTTRKCEEPSLTDTVALMLLYWDRQCEPMHRLASLQAPHAGQSVNHLHHRGDEQVV